MNVCLSKTSFRFLCNPYVFGNRNGLYQDFVTSLRHFGFKYFISFLQTNIDFVSICSIVLLPSLSQQFRFFLSIFKQEHSYFSLTFRSKKAQKLSKRLNPKRPQNDPEVVLKVPKWFITRPIKRPKKVLKGSKMIQVDMLNSV